MTDRWTDGGTDRQTDARGKTICLPTLSGGDIITKHLNSNKNIASQTYMSEFNWLLSNEDPVICKDIACFTIVYAQRS